MADTDLHPIFNKVVARAEKEKLLGQRAKVVWLYGLSGSGKSTLAVALEHRLHRDGFSTQLLDGDNLRTGLNAGLGFSDQDRDENLRRAAEVAKLFLQAGIVTLCSFITPLRRQRELARAIIGAEDFLEVYVRASFETCTRRDPKGIYAKAAAGQVRQFTGRDAAFETPVQGAPVWTIDTEAEPPAASLERLHGLVVPLLSLS